ncbi:zinc finger protein ZOP1 isoform X2 [Cicer arietinum]|uniref:Zinc finger protein ZOP1 isoform X2 n=1 Tax=Cicer arietinum TaxID=3827 RepID=A0A1S2YIX5_CICAR|nr:zinc finger protein ZOP1 isoform X2 [Cicer arietinum]
MTEYWVSQGNKWCDFCKIYISNNPSSIRNHELGQRHKDNVTKRLATMRKENAAKEKEHKETANALEQIEARAQRSYQKDKAKFEEARESHELDAQEWEFDSSSGYYYHKTNGFCYDQKSGFYYSDAIGKWVTHDEAYASPHFASNAGRNVPSAKKGMTTSQSKSVENKVNKHDNGPLPGPVVRASLNPMRNAKAAPSSLSVGKRKRPNERSKVISEEEKEALKAREAARKRVEQREKPLLGLYSKPY